MYWRYWAINLEAGAAPTIKIPSDFFKNTPNHLATILAVVAFNKTVPNTIINTKGVIYSAPTSPLATSFDPNKEAIPAATIPLGPTQPINSFSLSWRPDPELLKKTPKGRTIKIMDANNSAVRQSYNNINWSMLMLAANSIKRIEMSSTLKDSLKYKSSLRLGRFIFPMTIPIITTAKRPDSWAKKSEVTKTNNTIEREATLSK